MTIAVLLGALLTASVPVLAQQSAPDGAHLISSGGVRPDGTPVDYEYQVFVEGDVAIDCRYLPENIPSLVDLCLERFSQ